MNSKVNGGKIEPEALFRRDASPRTAGAITKSAGGYAIADTSTTAQVGDIYRAETATTSAMVKKQYKVIEASTNSFTIASKDLPVLGDTFYVLGPVTPRHDSTGSIQATIDTTGLATSAKQDLLLAELQLKADLTETQPVSQVLGVLSTVNSSTTPLGISGVFTGTGEDTTNYSSVNVSLTVDRDGTLSIQFSSDNTNWDQVQSYAITVTTPGTAEGFFYQFMCEAKYFRIIYTNGATAQAVLRLQSIFKKHAGTSEVQAINVPVLANTDALVTKGVIYGVTTGGGGGYVAAKVTPSGSFTMSLGDITGVDGQTTMALSLPVTMASDQTDINTLAKNAFLSSAANSSTTPLAGGATFTGTSIDTTGYASISVLVASDVASAADGLKIEYSSDGTNWDDSTIGTYTVGTAPNAGQIFGGGIRARYARVVYVNGASAQAAFRLSTTLRSVPFGADVIDMEVVPGINGHGILTKSVITGKTTAGGGAFVDVKVNPSGTLETNATLAAGTAIVGKVGIDQTTPGTTNGVQVNAALPAGTNMIGYQTVAAIAGSTNATSRVSSTALETGHVIKNAAGRLYSLVVTNTKTSAQFIQIHNTTSVPADTAVPIYSFYVPASSSVSIASEDIGDYFDTGISVCNSSTAATKTIGAADCFFTARYL